MRVHRLSAGVAIALIACGSLMMVGALLACYGWRSPGAAFLVDDHRDLVAVLTWAVGLGMVLNGIVRSCRPPAEVP